MNHFRHTELPAIARYHDANTRLDVIVKLVHAHVGNLFSCIALDDQASAYDGRDHTMPTVHRGQELTCHADSLTPINSR
tara:strand:- start:434 stop:670 length:237 start_codon:yes stop_codon:yes gene_type:complete